MKSLMPWFCLLTTAGIQAVYASEGLDAYRQGQYTQASESLTQLSKPGAIEHYYLGQMRLYGYGLLKQNDLAMASMKRAAEQGFLPAQNLMARYELLLKHNPEQALEWFKKAAAQNDTKAQMYCAGAYLFGFGVKQRADFARKYYISAAKNGNPVAQYTLAEHFLESRNRSNHKLGVIWLEKSVEQGNPNAQVKLGEFYATGKHKDKDPAKAQALFELAIQQGSVDGLFEMGALAQSQHSVFLAKDWYTKAAKADNIPAQIALAKLYFDEKNTFHDSNEGFLWMLKAAQHGSREARLYLSNLYAKGEWVDKDEHLAKAWKEKAEEKSKQTETDPQKAFAQWLSAGKQTEIAASGYRLKGIFSPWHNADALKENHYNPAPKMTEMNRAALYQPQFTLVDPNRIAVSEYYDVLASGLGTLEPSGFHFSYYPLDKTIFHYRVESPQSGSLGTDEFSQEALADSGVSESNAPETLALIFPEPEAVAVADADADANVGPDASKLSSYLRQKAVLGNQYAQFTLAQMHHQGIEVEKDIEQALHFYQLASDQKDLRAKYHLGLLYLDGQEMKPDYAQALSFLREAAFQGDARAEYALARLFEQGYQNEAGTHVIKPDPEQARNFYYLAAANHYGPAEYRLAELLLREKPTNVSLASQEERYQLIKRLYQQAADHGVQEAALPLAFFNAMDPSQNKQAHSYAVAKQKAEQGDPNAALLLAILYDRGIGTQQDQTQAVYWYQKAAENPVSAFILGTYHHQGKVVSQNQNQAKALLEQSARDGFSYAHLNLVMIKQQRGEYFLPDLKQAHALGNRTAGLLLADYYLSEAKDSEGMKQAREIYQNLAKKGDRDAQLKLAYMFEQGLGGQADRAQAGIWYEKSAEQGQSIAQYALGRLYQLGWLGQQPDYQQAKKWYNLAKNEYSPAAVALGFLYETVDENYQKAFDEYQLAVKQKDPIGDYNLGLMYSLGKGRAVDIQQAESFFRTAANAGQVNAMTQLGWLSLHGGGVVRDEQQAFGWFQKAAAKGDRDALYQLGLLSETGVGTQLDIAKALEFYQQSAQKGNAKAMLALARVYQYGQGVPKDEAKAMTYYQQLAALNHPFAQYQLAMLSYGGVVGEASPKEGKRLLERAQSNGSRQAKKALQWLEAQSKAQGSYLEPVLVSQTNFSDQSANLMYLDALNQWNQGNEAASRMILDRIVSQFPNYGPAQQAYEALHQQGMSTRFGASERHQQVKRKEG